MTFDQIQVGFFPCTTKKTMRNKLAAGLLPRRSGEVFDTRDVAGWWNKQRKRRAA